MTLKHEVTSDFIVEAIETFFDMRVKNNPECIDEARLSLKVQLLDLVEQCGVGENTLADIVDNYLFDGDFISRADTECPDDEDWDDIAWENYCSEHSILFNYEYACLNF